MKVIVCLAVCCVIVMMGFPAYAEEERFGLRVIADDDSDQAQTRKYSVRDAVLAALWPRFLGCASDSERARLFSDFLPEALVIARGTGDARVEMTGCAPDGTLCVTMTITLGEGRGRNWFGVLCPEVMEGLSEGDTLKWRVPDILLYWLLYDSTAS